MRLDVSQSGMVITDSADLTNSDQLLRNDHGVEGQ